MKGKSRCPMDSRRWKALSFIRLARQSQRQDVQYPLMQQALEPGRIRSSRPLGLREEREDPDANKGGKGSDQ